MFQYTYALQVLLGARGEISCIYIIIDEGFLKKAIISLLLVLSIALLWSCVDKSNKYGYSKYGNHSAAASNYYQSKKNKLRSVYNLHKW